MWAGRNVTRKYGKAHKKRVGNANIEQTDTKVHTFHIHPPTHGPFPLLPRPGYPSQPSVTIDGLALLHGHIENRRVGGVEGGFCRAGEEGVDVVDLRIGL